MADLPTPRVQVANPFEHTGVDYFGPMYIKERKYRNRSSVKVYGRLFICLATKFVHIEIASDMTTAGFFGAFRRFIGRRGIPSHIYSDNGLNFIGARNELRELYDLFGSDQLRSEVNNFAVKRNTNWHFNPPASPHFGGIWEAAVKSFKHHLKRVIGKKLLTYEELNTLAIEVEAILNSRPLCSVSTDPNDPISLTPADIVVGRKLTMLPENNLLSVPENRLSSWRYITQVRQDFWKRWQLEYLSELRKRQKWYSNGSADVKEGSVVILIDKDKPCMVWELGVILEVFPGSDGVNRVIKIKTSRGIFMRNPTTVCPLPFDS